MIEFDKDCFDALAVRVNIDCLIRIGLGRETGQGHILGAGGALAHPRSRISKR